MTMPRRVVKQKIPDIPMLPLGGGEDGGARWLIAAVLAAGKDGCLCDACKLLKRFGEAMSTAMLEEGDSNGNQHTIGE